MPPKQPVKKSASGSKDAGIVAYCHVCTIVHPEPVDQHCNLASPQDIAQFVLVNNLSVVDMGESSDSDIQSAQRQPLVTTEAPYSELPVTTGEDTTTTVVNINSSNILSADNDMLPGIQSPFNVQQLHAMLSCQPTNVMQSPISTPTVQHVLQTPGPRPFIPLESPTQLRFTSQPPKRNVIYQVLNTKGQLLGTTTLHPSAIVSRPSTPATVTPTITHRIVPTQAASVEDRPQSPPPTVVSSATQPLSVSFTNPLMSNPDCRSKLQDQSTASQSRLPASADTVAIPQPPLRHPLSSPEAYNQLLLSIRQTIRDETAARQHPQQATLQDVLEQDLQHRATRESLVQLRKQLTLQNEQRAKHHKHHKKGHPSQHKHSKSGSRHHKRQRSPQPFQTEQQPEPTTSKELTIQQINALLQAAKQEAKLKQPLNPDAPTLSQHNTNTQLSPHNTTTTIHGSTSLPPHPPQRILTLQPGRWACPNVEVTDTTRNIRGVTDIAVRLLPPPRRTQTPPPADPPASSPVPFASMLTVSPSPSSGQTCLSGGPMGFIPTYQDLTFTEFMFGIVSKLFCDAMTTSLKDTMTCHRRVLEALEKGEFDPTSWSQWNVRRREALDRILRNPSSATNKNNKAKPATPGTATNKSAKRARPCAHWNRGACVKGPSDHETASVLWLHVCSYCFTKGDKHRNREPACMKKDKEHEPKNSKGPSRGAN